MIATVAAEFEIVSFKHCWHWQDPHGQNDTTEVLVAPGSHDNVLAMALSGVASAKSGHDCENHRQQISHQLRWRGAKVSQVLILIISRMSRNMLN